MLSAAQLLDELMGRDRNLAPDEKRCNVRWDHEAVSELKKFQHFSNKQKKTPVIITY
uniref:Uncharacterized protein n=1 Tax=Sinocyclocheilus grahami TaxID=75366 RepID=A0A672KUX0_SINGR